MKTPQITQLTGLRGIAACWVALYHYREVLPATHGQWLQNLAAYGFLAVDLFFILSGFVIQLNYARLFRKLSWVGLREFAFARFARIYPLYIFVTLLFLLNPVAILLFSNSGELGPRYDPEYFWLSLVLAQNWGFTHEIAWNGAAWSISAEFGAYAVFPILSVLIATQVVRRVSIFAGLVFALAATAMFFRMAGADTLGSDIAHLGLMRCIIQFAAGMLLAELYRMDGPPSARLQAVLMTVFLAGAILAFGAGIPDFYVMPAGFAALILAFTRPGGLLGLAGLFGSAFMVFLGEISYAVYLIHSFVKDWINFVLVRPGIPVWLLLTAYVLGVAVAAVTLHRLVELPARKAVLGYVRRHWVLAGPALQHPSG